MKKNQVYLIKSKKEYHNSLFCVKDYFKELDISISLESDLEIYQSFRELLMNMGLDKENQHTEHWNPFKDFIKPNDHVLIKPNLVKHINAGEGTIDCLITNFSILRPIIDYTILALNQTGKIIVGDAPVQECDFNELKKINHLEDNIKKYQTIYENISLIDFRKNQNPDIACQTVQINEFSSFKELDEVKKEYAITNYNLSLMNEHHKKGIHEYIIPVDVLDADVIINVPKPKTHRKAGITACMKNFVGINGNKECLPHHRSGGPKQNGDEFPENNLLKNIYSHLAKQSYRKNKLIDFTRKVVSFGLSKIHLNRFQEGSWYGNDTIYRTILDLNKLVLYTDKKGILQKTPQRVLFNVADMIISGEKEGPLLPMDKKVGLIVASFNPLDMDYVICQIMGFDPKKIKYIDKGYQLKELPISLSNKKVEIFANDKKIKNLKEYNYHFQATDGWKDYLEK